MKKAKKEEKKFVREEKAVKKETSAKTTKKETPEKVKVSETGKFTRPDTSDIVHACKVTLAGKNKDKPLFYNPYTKNQNQHDMLKIHAGCGNHSDSMVSFVLQSLLSGVTKEALLKSLEKFINPDAKADNKASVLLSKSRYRLRMSGLPTVYDKASDTFSFTKGIPVNKSK